ncbi:hypothetical protein D3P07_08700 [Paenibacillus sp. 1011MAR3C5]|uniref:hypothetical protein n=1 Tax=Paenibacillus sp. 1011MAR3C5 TaxID=1675787 RepID=UPI000E6B9158|nr:hypothetical protein [Paenibacillus sp. 1011MAR3C5]RJE90275.1 hypothetical protein D3P07_08700 [Paenibacillus sp. 1011MAR3C5]
MTFTTKRPVAYWMLLLIPFNVIMIISNKLKESSLVFDLVILFFLIVLLATVLYYVIKMKKHNAVSTVELTSQSIRIASREFAISDIERLTITNCMFKLQLKGKWIWVAYTIDPQHREDIARKLADYSISHELALVNRVKPDRTFS